MATLFTSRTIAAGSFTSPTFTIAANAGRGVDIAFSAGLSPSITHFEIQAQNPVTLAFSTLYASDSLSSLSLQPIIRLLCTQLPGTVFRVLATLSAPLTTSGTFTVLT